MSATAERRVFYVALILFACLLFYRLGSWGVLETSEARYAEMSAEMYRSGDLLHPTFMELGHYHKPPLTYVITAGAYSLFGPTPFAVRFFLQLALLLQIWLVYSIGRLLFADPARVRLATLIYCSFPILLVASRSLTTDLYLTTFLLLGVWCWLRAESGGRPLPWTLAAYLAWALACLTKGAGVVILPLVLLPVYYLLNRPDRWRAVIGRHALGGFLFLLVGLSWYARLVVEDPSFFHYFTVEQTIQRYASDRWQRAQPWGFYLLTVSATSLPWCWLAVARLRAFSWSRQMLFLLSWIVGPFLFYSFAQSKLVLYVLPIYAGLALFSAVAVEGLSVRVSRQLGRGLGFLFGALFVALTLLPLVVTEIHAGPLYYGWGGAAGASLFIMAKWVGTRSVLSSGYRVVLPVLLFNLLLLPVSAEFLYHNELLVNATAPVTDFLTSSDLAGRPVYLLHRRLPSVAFALGRPVTMLYDGEIGRDTSRQVDTRWQPYYRNMLDARARDRLRRQWSAQPPVVIGYRQQDSLSLELLRPLSQHKRIGRYTVYY